MRDRWRRRRVPRVRVGDANADKRRWTLGFTRHVHQTGVGLRDEVETWALRERPCLPESGDRRHDQIRLDLTETPILESAALEDARARVLDHHVDVGNEFAYDLSPFVTGDIDADAALSAVLLDVSSGPTVDPRAVGAVRIAVWWLLDLDDVGPELAEQASACGTGEIPGQVENDDALEPAVAFAHTITPSARGATAALVRPICCA